MPSAPSQQRRSDQVQLTVVVPCFNEEAVIGLTHRALVEALGDQPDFDLDIVYVDDGSRDATEAMLLVIADADPRVTVVSLSRNFGHQPAVSAGLEQARGDIVAVIDADLQDPPEVILQMIAAWRDGADVVYGVRAKRKESALHRLAYFAFYRLYKKMAEIDVPLDSGDFALMDRQVVRLINRLPEKNRFLRGLRAWAGYRQTGLVYERAARAAGETKYPLSKLIRLAMNGIFDFSTVPLAMISTLGMLTAMVSAFGGLLFFLNKTTGLSVFGMTFDWIPGFTALILTMLFLGGVQLLSIGIVGQYIGRIYYESKQRPAFVVKSVHGKGAGSA